MKTICSIIVIFSFLGIQLHAQISTETLQKLYDNKEYAKAISYVSNFENSSNDKALYILGNCYYEQAAQVEKENLEFYNQTLYIQSMNMSMGIYVDNTFALNLYYQRLNEVLQKRLKAYELYSKAAKLGNANANNKLKLLEAMYGSNNSSYSNNYSQSPSGSSYKTSQPQKCGYCNGTGKVSSTVPTYGQTGTKYCYDCGQTVSLSHCCQCKVCPSCGGKGSR